MTIGVTKVGLIGTDTHKGGNLRRAVAMQLYKLRKGGAHDRLAVLRSAWAIPHKQLRVATVKPLLWQAHLELYCAMLGRMGVPNPKETLADLCDVQPLGVSRWLRATKPVAPSFLSRHHLTRLMPDIVFPPEWRK